MRLERFPATVFAMAIAGCAASGAPSQAAPLPTTILIENSGSTNTIGYRISVGASGEASFVSGAGPGSAMLADALVSKLRQDAAAASPLSSLPSGGCMKSASFGTSLHVVVGGDRSSDLSCPGSDSAKALADDAGAVAAALHVANVPRSAGKELPPLKY